MILPELTKRLDHRPRTPWWTRIAEWKSRFAFGYDPAGQAIKPQQIIEELCRQTRGQAIITTGVGQHQMWTAQFYKFSRPRQFITSGGLGTMGFGLPAAIGAQLAQPDALVIDIDGDHSFNMTMAELITAVAWRLPIKICIMNNGHMGMVRQWQELFYEGRYAHSRLENPDYAAFARAVGAGGVTVTSRGDVPAAVARMLAEDGPCLLDFHVEAEENVWPMVPAGRALDEMQGLQVLEEAA